MNTPRFDLQETIYGHGTTDRIVGVLARPADDGPTRFYVRGEDDAVREVDVPFRPFLWANRRHLKTIRENVRGLHYVAGLSGPGAMDHVVAFENPRDFWAAQKAVRAVSGDFDGRLPDDVHRIGSLDAQLLVQTGETMYGGMDFNDVRRLALDIEVYNERGGFPDAGRREDRVILVSLADNRGGRRVLDLRDFQRVSADAYPPREPEALLLEALVEHVRAFDPDVIELHNGFGFDLPYLRDRCNLHDVPFALGRDGSEPRTWRSKKKVAEREIEFENFAVAGRAVVDTFFAAADFDVFARDLPGYGLKEVAKYFGVAAEGREYVEGDEIARVWREDPDRLAKYAVDDAVETLAIAERLTQSGFYCCQMAPFTFGEFQLAGTGAKVENLLLRAYLRRREAVPTAPTGSAFTGGYTSVFVQGVVGQGGLGPDGVVRPEGLLYADFESLYPYVMLTFDVAPASDSLGVFRGLLEAFVDLRFKWKNEMRAAETEAERQRLDGMQSSAKIYINSFFGYLGYAFGLFADFGEAYRVTANGQRLLKLLISEVTRDGGRVIEVDTDGIIFEAPPHVHVGTREEWEAACDEAAERTLGAGPFPLHDEDYVLGLTDRMPQGIKVGFDGRFRRMVSYKSKNYALLKWDGGVKVKGSSFKARSGERFGRDFVGGGLRDLLEGTPKDLHDRFHRMRQTIACRAWGVEHFARVETLKDSPDVYERKVRRGERNAAAAYEVALRTFREGGPRPQVGDRVSYYLQEAGRDLFGGSTPQDGNVAARAVPAAAWDPERPDEDSRHYYDRLLKFANRFRPFLGPLDGERVFGRSATPDHELAGVRWVEEVVNTPETEFVFEPVLREREELRTAA